MKSMSIVFAGLVLLALLVEVIAANSEPSGSSPATQIQAGHGQGISPALPEKIPAQ